MKIIEKIKKNGLVTNGVPRDADGNPCYTYVKSESINGKENYKYSIFGHYDYMPASLDGAPVPVGSLFVCWDDTHSGEVYIMGNSGWAVFGE